MKENDLDTSLKEQSNRLSQDSFKKSYNLNHYYNCKLFILILGDKEYKLMSKLKISENNSRNETKLIKTSTNLPSLTIEPKDFYYKNCFTKPNIYYTTKSIYKVKIEETSDNLNSLSRNISNDIKTVCSEKWKIKVKSLNQTNTTNENVFITLNTNSEDNKANFPPKLSSMNKLRKMHSINVNKLKFVREKKTKFNISDYNKKVLESNKKKNLVIYNSFKKTLHLPSLVYNSNQEKSNTNSHHIRMSESCRIGLVKKAFNIDTL